MSQRRLLQALFWTWASAKPEGVRLMDEFLADLAEKERLQNIAPEKRALFDDEPREDKGN